MENTVKIEMPFEHFNDYMEDNILLLKKAEELDYVLDLLFDNAELGIDEYHLSIAFPSEVMDYLKFVEKDRYISTVEELRKKYIKEA